MTAFWHPRKNTSLESRRTPTSGRTSAPLAVVAKVAALVAALWAGPSAWAKHHHHHDGDAGAPGLANATILIVRHAEKPAGEGDPGLTPAGTARAKAYASYFRHFTLEGTPVHIDTLVATADSDASARPRLTLEPLSAATGLPITHDFANHDVKEMARWLEASPHGNVLIAWHHGKLPKLLDKLGVDPTSVLPGGEWPEDVYNWVIALHYDAEGDLVEAKRIVEPDDLK